jgi:tetratricopeptide (TPR) repeat protein
MARRLEDVNALAYALNTEVWHCWNSAAASERSRWVSVATEAVTTAQAANNLDLLAAARMLRATALLERGDIAEVREEFARYVELADKLQNPMYLWFAQLTEVAFATLEGHFEEAERLALAAFEQGQRIQSPMAPIFHLVHRFAVARERGALVPWLSNFDPNRGPFPYSFGMVLAALAHAHLERGDRAAGTAEIERLMAAGFASQLVDLNWPSILTLAADAAAALEHHEAAAELYELLSPHAGMIACLGSVVNVLGFVDHSLGVLALTLGNNDRALEHLEQAHRLAQSMGATPWQSRCDLALARAHAARGARESAAAHLAEAERSARALSMHGLLAELEAERAGEQRELRA